MICVEGYKAFHGTMRITPKCSVPPFEITADWLYKPDTGCWYGGGGSYPAGICEVEVDGCTGESNSAGKIEKCSRYFIDDGGQCSVSSCWDEDRRDYQISVKCGGDKAKCCR